MLRLNKNDENKEITLTDAFKMKYVFFYFEIVLIMFIYGAVQFTERHKTYIKLWSRQSFLQELSLLLI